MVALLDEWAARFFEELDYVKEGQNATIFAQQMARDLPQVCLGMPSVCLLFGRYASLTHWCSSNGVAGV